MPVALATPRGLSGVCLSGARDLYAALGLPGGSWPWRPLALDPTRCVRGSGEGVRARCDVDHMTGKR